jgi:NADPH-dependent curcumin reductase CurA
MTGVRQSIHLRRRPDGLPKPDDFALIEDAIPSPGPYGVRTSPNRLSNWLGA